MAAPLTLDSNLVFQLFGDPTFYVQNPCFLFMEEQGASTHSQYRTMIEKKQKCSNCSMNYMKTALGTFAKVLKRLHEVAPPEIDRFMTYVTQRLGYRPEYVLLYYNDKQGRLQELKLGQREQGGSHGGTVHPAETLAADARHGAQQG